MRIGSFDTSLRVLLVAEVGNNHEGRFDVAKELVRQAAASGVDAVKFQTFRAELFVSPRDAARLERLRKFELTHVQFAELGELARSLGLLFMSTPLDLPSAKFLAGVVDALKIASGDNDCWPLLREAASAGKPLIVSSGMTDLPAIRRAVDFARAHGARDLAVLHCVSSYPAPDGEVNLRAIPLLAAELGCEVGYSDHTLGIDACVAAAALGARILEKHFTLDKNYSEFRDHQLSADPTDMKELVARVRRTETLLGRAEKARQPCEASIEPIARRSIAAASVLSAGHRLKPADLVCLRPAGGIPPSEEELVVGRVLRRSLASGEALALADLE